MVGPPTDAPWLRHLRTEVRSRLQVRHVTQASLAAHLDVTPKHLNQVLGGHVVGSPELLARMAEAVGLQIAIVLTDREPVPLAEDKRPWLSGNRTPRGKTASSPACELGSCP
jgi:transcriptional regulator with XRE-family HTH domain